MIAENDPADKYELLRKQAESLLKERKAYAPDPSTDILTLIHELRIHQAELEIQNEDLKQAQLELSELYHQLEDLYEFAPCGYLSLNPKGIVTRINLAGVMLLDALRQKVLHTGFSQFLDPDYENAYMNALQMAGRTGEKQCLELQLQQMKSAPIWVWAEIQADRGEDESVNQWRLTMQDISPIKEAEAVLRANENKYQKLFYNTVSAAILLEVSDNGILNHMGDARILEVNTAFERLTGIPIQQAVNMPVNRVLPQAEDTQSENVHRALQTHQPIEVQGTPFSKNRHFLMSAFWVDDRRIGITFIDISAQKTIEWALEQARRQLESQVKNKTAKLHLANKKLHSEIKTRRQAQQSLVHKSQELEVRSGGLQDANTALRVVLKELKNERADLEEKIVCNLNEVIQPYIEALEASRLNSRQRAFLNIIKTNLEDIASPMNRRFIIEQNHLTPIETKVANLIRQAKSTKEIAALLGVAKSTVAFHRLNIRRKLRLTNKRVNLQLYLRSLD